MAQALGEQRQREQCRTHRHHEGQERDGQQMFSSLSRFTPASSPATTEIVARPVMAAISKIWNHVSEGSPKSL